MVVRRGAASCKLCVGAGHNFTDEASSWLYCTNEGFAFEAVDVVMSVRMINSLSLLSSRIELASVEFQRVR